MNINSLDLNLLKVFDALYHERHVGRAGQAIGLAQPSVSNALNRLRARFDDPLFLRSPKGMTPTAKANEMAPKVTAALAAVSALLVTEVFDPKVAVADIAIAASDLTVLTLAPQLMTRLGETAPNLRISFLPLDKQQMVEQLDDGQLTLAIGTFGSLPSRFHRRALFRDSFVCISGETSWSGEADLEQFAQAKHALVTLGGGFSGAVDKAMKKLGYKRRVVMTCTQFSLLPDIVVQSDLVATIPASLSQIAKRAGCHVFDPPLALPSWQVEMIWTQQTAATPLGAFVTDLVQDVSAQSAN